MLAGRRGGWADGVARGTLALLMPGMCEPGFAAGACSGCQCARNLWREAAADGTWSGSSYRRRGREAAAERKSERRRVDDRRADMMHTMLGRLRRTRTWPT